MAESPKRRADVSQSDASRSRVAKPSPKTDKPPGETAKASDSVPLAGGQFIVLPMKFGRYQLLKELGRGQMGAVYLAQDTELDRPVALKVARTSSSGSAKLLKRMEVEAKAAAVVDHPLICKVYDAGEIDGIRFIALQYVEGEDLKKFLKRTGHRLDPKEAVRIILQILRALEAAHEKGIIHRDLKPANVMLNKKNEPVIMDFGLARRTIGSSDAGLTQGMILGTAAYMSPEQAIGKADGIDHRSDLYAVGVMLFEMLTGAWPFTGGAIEVMGKKCVQSPPSPLSLNPDLPPQLAAVCDKMIAQKKEDRYATSVEIIMALEEINVCADDQSESAVRRDEFTNGLDFLKELPVETVGRRTAMRTGRQKPARESMFDHGKRLAGWWNNGTLSNRTIIGGGMVAFFFLIAAILFFPTPYGVVRIEIDDPAISVKFEGSMITVDNHNRPIRIKATDKHTFEVLHHDGTSIESVTQELSLKSGEKRVLKVSLIDGDVVIDGKPVKTSSEKVSVANDVQPEVRKAITTTTPAPDENALKITPDGKPGTMNDEKSIPPTDPKLIARKVRDRSDAKAITSAAANLTSLDEGNTICRYGLTVAEFEQSLDGLRGRGFQMIDVSGYGYAESLYAAAWVKTDSPEWTERHGLTNEEYQQSFHELTAQRYRLTQVTGYEISGVTYYAAIWQKSDGPAWYSQHKLTAAQYEQESESLAREGFRVRKINGYSNGSAAEFAVIWEKSPGEAWIAKIGLSHSEYQQEFNRQLELGYRLIHVNGYSVNGNAQYTGVWEKPPIGNWVASHGINDSQFQRKFRELAGSNLHLVNLSVFSSGDQERFSALWVK